MTCDNIRSITAETETWTRIWHRQPTTTGDIHSWLDATVSTAADNWSLATGGFQPRSRSLRFEYSRVASDRNPWAWENNSCRSPSWMTDAGGSSGSIDAWVVYAIRSASPGWSGCPALPPRVTNHDGKRSLRRFTRLFRADRGTPSRARPRHSAADHRRGPPHPLVSNRHA